MNNNPIPYISLDLKKCRIRIYRNTFSLLGDPLYIQLLINPCKGELILHISVEEDYLAHKVRYEKFKKDSYELYSKELIHRIELMSPNLLHNNSYRIEGAIDQKGTSARFMMSNAVLIDKKENYRS